MAIPEVDQEMLRELESMGFPTARATRALHYSGNCSIDAAIDWVVNHEHDTDIDQMPLVPLNINIKSGKPSPTPETVKIKAQELRERVRRKNGEQKGLEREREKERIRVGKELLEAKRILQENERRRMLALRHAEKEEEKRAREKIRQRLEQDKAERRRMLGLPPVDSKAVKVTKPPLQEKNRSLPVKPATKAQRMRDCLRSLKKNHKDEDARVKRAFQTLLIYVGNVAKNPDEEKFRKIRLGNPAFQDRVGSLKGGIQFLELCGFEKLEGDEYLYLPRDKVDMVVLKTAGLELNSAITNPFFGVF
ncbi:UBX domain-containing protein 1-like isoform X2 [Phoenix dactylifera]|uniref:UBX domain-containing protein 1-like isoform X2 n=1 Tax=Phoenix dactylifera TaxID=42345 RepID=A0A8B8J6G2_PHODC|nr:UBX domain-containing protein 1-like isoform X2 [Phoenix dactylifera]